MDPGLGESITPIPTNELKASLTMRFRHVLTMVRDGVQFLEFGGRRGDFLLRDWVKNSESNAVMGPRA